MLIALLRHYRKLLLAAVLTTVLPLSTTNSIAGDGIPTFAPPPEGGFGNIRTMSVRSKTPKKKELGNWAVWDPETGIVETYMKKSDCEENSKAPHPSFGVTCIDIETAFEWAEFRAAN